MNVLVSIVIPCYNEERYIGECLQSIVDQSYLPDLIEVIVVDGNSTDKSMSIVQKYNKILPHLTQLMNPQKITPISLNIGVKSASGKIIIILGAHSFIHKDFIKNAIDKGFLQDKSDWENQKSFENPESENPRLEKFQSRLDNKNTVKQPRWLFGFLVFIAGTPFNGAV